MQWLTTADTAQRTQRPVKFVRRIAEQGELHGHQRLDRTGRPLPKSRWSFHPDAVDAYMRGGDELAQKRACGCAVLRAVGRAS